MTIKAMSLQDFRKAIADAINRVAYKGEQIALTRHGEIAAVLVSYEDLKDLRRLREAQGARTNEDLDQRLDRIFEKHEKLYRALAE